ncbi:MAG TPA: UDP-N-acetylmuramate--L-alanine ligase [Bacteroidales bacterium]|nr:UDP-N-acetylmuramate--L-alanine ligase [Bacteroidales bacterium]
MMDLKKYSCVYLIGIGGIGMSALARYFVSGGFIVAGYDRTESKLTHELEKEGCSISYCEDPDTIPALFSNPSLINRVLVIYTPAIPPENRIMEFFRNKGYAILKRSEVLGEISSSTDTIAVAGTHGKTSVSTLSSHILWNSGHGCSAFLGGVSKNYNTNLLLSKSRFTVIEADEYDRSFHSLSPFIALITATDADHLDVYGSYQSMLDAYNEFCKKIKPGGKLILNEKITERIIVPAGIESFVYGFSSDSDFRIQNFHRENDFYVFDLATPKETISNLRYPFPGKMNIENAAAASTIGMLCGVQSDGIRKALETFKGVRRRFDVRYSSPDLVYIDDYAHHPEEIRAFITAVREHFGTRKITAIFQPHLYSRTRDHADGFAAILDTLDEVILLPIYPAREKPIQGVDSSLILQKMKLENKQLLEMKDIPSVLDFHEIDVLLTIGAGDIDRLVEPIENAIKRFAGE